MTVFTEGEESDDGNGGGLRVRNVTLSTNNY